MNRAFLTILIVLLSFQWSYSNDSIPEQKKQVYVLKIQRDIGSTSWVHTQEAFEEANELKPECIIIHMNTYGGQVLHADSIRTKITNCNIPVHVFIDNNAISAGALISIACDSIYMRPGGNIGAATVVNQSGEKMPDKYQSKMRASMRAIAEEHGKDTIITGNDTIIKWIRDPHIAEAMVDESIYIPNIIDTGKILTFTTQEAILHGFCEGEAKSIAEVIEKLEIEDYEITTYKPSFYDGMKGFLTSPVLQGILMLIIIGGIYFELQTPGVGFPILASLIAAVLYFSPLYIDGLAENWEIMLFIIGIILIGLEVFVVPGFGVTGISGIILTVLGLTLSMLDNVKFDFSNVPFEDLFQALMTVMLSFLGAFIGGIWLTKKLLTTSGPLLKIALNTTQEISEGYISVDAKINEMLGKIGVAETDLRPSGKVIIDDEVYDAVAETGYIEEGTPIKVIRITAGQLSVYKTS